MDESNDLIREGQDFIEQQDKIHQKNKDVDLKTHISNNPIPTNLGRSITNPFESTIGGANDSHWKNIPLENLPSKGLFYADGTEITIKSASVTEVRQWSTMDENDKLDVDDTLNFIIEKCCRIKNKNNRVRLSWRDISELDRLALIFLIQELTFPGEENILYANFSCPGPCVEETAWKGELRISSPMLSFINFPQEIMQFYNPQYKCFVIESAKLNETFYLYMPTLGTIEKLRARISQAKADRRTLDKSFITIAPYIIQDWQNFTQEAYYNMSRDNFKWHINKFTFVTKFVKLLEAARNSMVASTCPKCEKPVSTALFSKSGFTIKDFFFISGGLNELI